MICFDIISEITSYILDVDGRVYHTDFMRHGFHPIEAFQNEKIKVKSIAAGEQHALFVTSNGRLFVNNDNEYGQLGMGDMHYRNDPMENTYFSDNTKIDQIVCGAFHSFVTDNNGWIYSFGWNESGQCGLKDPTEKIMTPQIMAISKKIKSTTIKAGYSHSLIATQNGQYYLFGSNQHNEITLRVDDRDKINSPFLINNVFHQLTNHCKTIKDICLGVRDTWITASCKQEANNEISRIIQESKEEELHRPTTQILFNQTSIKTPTEEQKYESPFHENQNPDIAEEHSIRITASCNDETNKEHAMMKQESKEEELSILPTSRPSNAPNQSTMTVPTEEKKFESPIHATLNITGEHDDKNIIKLDKVLVVMICIGDYSKEWNMPQLSSTQTDKNRLAKLFTEEYNYHVMTINKR